MKTKAMMESTDSDIEVVTQRQMDLILACMDEPKTLSQIEKVMGISRTQFIGGFYKLNDLGYVEKLAQNYYQSRRLNYVVMSTVETQVWRLNRTRAQEMEKRSADPVSYELPPEIVQQKIIELSKKRMNRTDIAKKLGIKKALVLWTLEHNKNGAAL